MIPARDRLTKLYVYDTEADMLSNINATEYTEGVVDGSQRFEHTKFTSFPGFGEVNSAMYQCEIANTTDLTGKYIRLKYCYFATDAATVRTEDWIYSGKVDSCKYDRQRITRTLVAYDKLYELRNIDISDWWLTYFSTGSDRTILTMFNAMCTAFGITHNVTSLRNNPTIVKDAQDGRMLGGCSVANMLSFIGQLCGVYWTVTVEGVLVAVTPSAANPIAYDTNVDSSNTEIYDADMTAYGTFTVYDGVDIIYSTGTGEPTYTINNNILLYGHTTAELATILDTTATYLAWFVGARPATVESIVSQPFIGSQAITVSDSGATRTCVISRSEMYGTQLINQRLTCTSERVIGTQYSSAMNRVANDIQKMGVEMTYKVNADNVIEAVNLEAQGGVTINAEAININGVISANGNFKVDTDGNLEANDGKFSGDVTSGDLIANGRVRITPDYDVQSEPAMVLANPYDGNTTSVDSSGIVVQDVVGESRLEAYSVEFETRDDSTVEVVCNGGAFQQESGITITVNRSPVQVSKLTENSLVVNNIDILRTHQSLVGGYGTSIPTGAALNTPTYMVVGRYYAPSDVVAASHSDCPTRYGYEMDVYAPISATIDDESGSGSKYRVRKLLTRYGDEYVQYASASGTTWTYGKWYHVFNDDASTAIPIDQVKSRNIANNATIRQGTFNGQGEPTSSTTRVRTGFISVIPSTQYAIRTNSSMQVYEIHEYTSGQSFIKYTAINATSTIFKTTSTTGNIRILMRYTDNRTVYPNDAAMLQVERGETFSPYTPYQEMSVSVPYYTADDLGASNTESSYFQAWLKRVACNIDYFGNKYIHARVRPDSSGAVYGHMYGGVNSAGFPLNSGFVYVGVKAVSYFGTDNGTFYLHNNATGSGTRNTTNTAFATNTWQRQGNLVTLSISKLAVYAAGQTDGAELISGLPAPISQIEFTATPYVGSPTPLALLLSITTSGKVVYRDGSTSTSALFAGTVTYVTAS